MSFMSKILLEILKEFNLEHIRFFPPQYYD